MCFCGHTAVFALFFILCSCFVIQYYIWHFFIQRLVENTNITSCYNELLSIDHSELEYRSHQQVQTSAAMYHALNHVLKYQEALL